MTRQVLYILLGVAILLVAAAFFLIQKETPESITYGISFNTVYAHELGLDPEKVYDAFLDELGARHLRLAAHWNMVEPEPNQYDFSSLDYQVARAEAVGAEVVFAVGRRLPRWPECHVPQWAQTLSWEEQKESLRTYIRTVVDRYKTSPAITYWQVENEPYLEVFARQHCGSLDEEFLKEEIALVKEVDGTRPVLVTDSGNLGTWWGAYKQGDAFGTSVYVYFWNPELGQFKTVLPPWWYRLKEGVLERIFGEKETFLIELSLEPWLVEPIRDVPIPVQYSRMNVEKFREIVSYARKTRYERQYLWGGEWWYWLREHGRPEMWEEGKALFR